MQLTLNRVYYDQLAIKDSDFSNLINIFINFKSSANNLVAFFNSSGRSLTNKTKSNGPKTDP